MAAVIIPFSLERLPITQCLPGEIITLTTRDDVQCRLKVVDPRSETVELLEICRLKGRRRQTINRGERLHIAPGTLLRRAYGVLDPFGYPFPEIPLVPSMPCGFEILPDGEKCLYTGRIRRITLATP